MLNKDNKNRCYKLLAKNGCSNQMQMVIEECAELTKAICKVNRDEGDVTDEHDENLREELVDVIVMCQQMLLILRMGMDEVNSRASAKMERALR